MGRRSMITKAKPVSIKFTDEHGYELIVHVTEGPSNLLGKRLVVQLNNEQLDAIDNWQPTGKFSLLELDK